MFDNNIYQKIIIANRYEKDILHKQYDEINSFLVKKLIQGYLSEAIFQIDLLNLDNKLSIMQGKKF